MPGPYAHITLLHELMRPARLKSIFAPFSGCAGSMASYFPYCVLGAVSPDYPNLAGNDGPAARWADVMHCTRACAMMVSGINLVRCSSGAARDKQLAWLLGYCAHVATDVTIHPVVRAKVGEYAANQRQHRICEMNQDSYIYRRMNLGEIGESDTFAVTITGCGSSDDRFELDHDIVALWQGMLAEVHPLFYADHPPDIAAWHRQFVAMVAANSSCSLRLFPLAGIIAGKIRLPYPPHDQVDYQFVEEQAVPAERPLSLHYDEIFDHAAGNVMLLWRQVEQALASAAPPDTEMFGDWDLDTGCDRQGRLVFWE